MVRDKLRGGRVADEGLKEPLSLSPRVVGILRRVYMGVVRVENRVGFTFGHVWVCL